jgi:hypothetical protein
MSYRSGSNNPNGTAGGDVIERNRLVPVRRIGGRYYRQKLAAKTTEKARIFARGWWGDPRRWRLAPDGRE